ncbi:MAG: peptide MFS transporter [Rhabdochlamydiaceae bacterium]|jgi:POT family proton-dependent oligopeptide transporter
MAKALPSPRQPKAMYLLALTEMCQRFAFWGIGNLLVLYLVQHQNFSDIRADHLFGLFTGVAFVLPVIGGYIADRMNYRLPVICGILCSSIGCFLITFGNVTMLYVALGLIAIGAAIFTPSIYALLGSLYHNDHSLRDSGFTIYYSSVNLGVFLAMILLGFIGTHDWNLTFIIAGGIQLMGLLPFYGAIKSIKASNISPAHFKIGEKKNIKMHSHEKKRIWVICILSFFSILFWMAYNQGGSSMNLFALNYTNRNVMGFEMPASWLLSSESLYLVIFAVPLAKLYMSLSKRNLDPTPPMKSAFSLLAIGVCFLIMSFGASQIPTGALRAAISPWFLFVAYAFMALGEMLIAPIGLSLITHLSPRRFTAMLIGVWYLCIGIAFYLGGLMAPLMSKLANMNSFFGIFVVISFLFGVALLLLVKKLDKMRHLNTL